MKKIAGFILGCLAWQATAYADMVGYNGVITLKAESGIVRAEHHHDWSAATQEARWKMISTTQNPFTADNNYSYLALQDKKTGAELFRHPVPALTYLWISPDSKYIVGISKIMLWNPYQLVVFSKAGKRLLERNLVGVRWPGVSQSVTNWIRWYKEPVPKINLVEKEETATLSVEDPLGNMRQFKFPVAP